jgi:hypothetical protein
MVFIFSKHAIEELQRRGLPKDLVESVLQRPEQIVEEIEGLKAHQSRVDFGSGQTYLLRIVVNEHAKPASVVTAYRTSKITKYWRES